jgi:hypothetical protein
MTAPTTAAERKAQRHAENPDLAAMTDEKLLTHLAQLGDMAGALARGARQAGGPSAEQRKTRLALTRRIVAATEILRGRGHQI